MALGAVAFGSLRGVIAVFGLRTGGVRCSSLVFLPTAASTAAKTGGRAEVQGPRGGGGICRGLGEVEGWKKAHIPYQPCCVAGGS